MMDEMNRAPVPSELTEQARRKAQREQETLLAELAEVKEDRDLDRMEAAITARLQSQKQSQQARSVVRTRPLMVPKLQPVGRGRGRR